MELTPRPQEAGVGVGGLIIELRAFTERVSDSVLLGWGRIESVITAHSLNTFLIVINHSFHARF